MVGAARCPAQIALVGTEALTVAVVAGRRIDPLGAKVVRFPLSHAPLVRGALKSLFEQHKVRSLVVCAACGTDLLAASVAMEQGLELHLILPVAPEVFLAESVTDRPGQWMDVFWESVDYSRCQGNLLLLGLNGISHATLLKTNRFLLERAHQLTKASGIIAVVAWNGERTGATDYTSDFREIAMHQKLRVVEIRTC